MASNWRAEETLDSYLKRWNVVGIEHIDTRALVRHIREVLLEAIAAGLPLVSTTVGGIPEIVEHQKSAFLIEARDIKGMAQGLERVLSDAEFARMG